MSLRVGVDIDGTITTLDAILNIFNRETNKKLTLEDLIFYDVGKSYGITKEEAGRIWGKYSVEMYQRSIPIWNVHTFLADWRSYKQTDKGQNEIIFVTARKSEHSGVTKEWLKQNHIKYDEIYFNFENKIDAVRQHFLDIMVEDRAEAIRDIDKARHVECETFIVDRPYNRWYGLKNRMQVQDSYKDKLIV